MNTKEIQVSEFKLHMQKIMRSFPSSNVQTPCGVKISTSLAHVLLALHKASGEVLNQQILAKELGLNKSSIARICSDLELKGFIQIKVNDDDKRNNKILLTTKGLNLSLRLKKQGDQYFQSVLDKIPKNELNNLLNSLKILTEALEDNKE